MSIWDKIDEFSKSITNAAEKFDKKMELLEKKTVQYCEDVRIKDFYKIKRELVELNEKQRSAGIKETTVFDFFKDRPEYADLLEKERNKK